MTPNIAAAIQSQMLQTLLQALQSADQTIKAGNAVEAKFLGWSGIGEPAASTAGKPPLSEALVQIGGKAITLLIEATPERRALMQPGATLTLQVDAVAGPGAPARMRLLTIEAARVPGTATGPHGQAAEDAAAPAQLPSARPAAVAAEAARAAAGPLIGAALGRQNGLAPLFADLDVLVRAPVQLPTQVVDAATRALGMRTDAGLIDRTPDMLRSAVASSGLFHEALVAGGAPGDAAKDLKGALIALRQALKDGLGLQAGAEKPKLPAHDTDAARASAPRAAAEMQGAARPQAPVRGGLPAPQGVAEPSIAIGGDSASTMMAKALERTEGALERLSISQFASLPATAEASQGAPLNRWFAELPLALDGRTAVLPIEIEEDHGGGGHSGPQAKLWRVRFALDVEPMGPLHAMVTMQGRAIGVTVWAERDATSQLVRDHAPDLKAALLDSDFDNPQIEVLAGQPMKRAAHAGHYLDRRT